MSSVDQGVVLALTGEAGDSGLVSESSNSVRSLVKPALHVGKHSLGGCGCLACVPSGGIWAGSTTVGSELILQPASSAARVISISACAIRLGVGFIDDLLVGGGPSSFFGTPGLFGMQCQFGDLGTDFMAADLALVLGPELIAEQQGQDQTAVEQ